ncbi:digeranylgeranylglycerophospholipid reductase [Natronoarchaeum philippinense]|uniref:Digeranylgeranylglycerophospholipid reductase n=2 Tax=Natronoarchaeum philippinense TaxID=558529 RepID=A0A285P0G2_NATPI|nr:digeranylgeranylglycerophospholipid reductase [Natronoarchaeum philippinense]
MTTPDDDRHDVVIAGAGPAGGQCARDIAARGYDVVVLEAEQEDGFPGPSNKSTAGTFHSMMSAFQVPDTVVQNYTDNVVLESPNSFYNRDHAGAVLDFAAFKRWLVDAAREEGAEVRFGARVSKPILENGEIVGVRYNGDEEIYGDIVVDATGPSAPLAKELDVSNLHRETQAIGIDYEVEGIDLDHRGYADLTDSMMLRLDHDIAPGGYSWIFHTGGDTAKVGVCYIQNDRHREQAVDGMRIDDYMDRWLDDDPRFEDAYRPDDGNVLRGSAHIQMPGELHTDNFMAIGDTVPSIDPLWGEGIHKGMKSGRVAAVAADYCLAGSTPDTSAENIGVYDQLWHNEVAPNMHSRLMLTELLYLARNERYDTLMNDLRRADGDVLAGANKGGKLDMAKLLHLSDVPLVAKWLKGRLKDPSGRWNPMAGLR